MKTFRNGALFFALVICACKGWAQSPVINSLSAGSSVAKFEKFEVSVNLTAGYTNPYDYDDITVQAIFTSPAGLKDTIDGFFMHGYTVDGSGYAAPTNNNGFKIRYAPKETGTYSYVVSCKNTVGNTTFATQNFESIPSESKGFIRTNASNYLSFDDSSQYIPIGENVGWQNNKVTADYSNWVGDLSDNGANFIRIWMSSWAFGLEWKNTYAGDGYAGLKKYKQSSAFYLDWLLDYCANKNVYVMLTLNNHGQVSSNVNPEWSSNPYNSANGGPATNTWDFFTNQNAKTLHKNRLRYIVARYGYSTQIQSWELFNEVVWTNDFEAHKSEITAWDNEMATYLKKTDANKHLVTSSYGGTDKTTDTWNLPNIDFTQTHFYVQSPAIETTLSAANQQFLSQYKKPTLNGEFGITADEGSGSTTNLDPAGIHFHNALWATAFSGSMGPAMTWWWDSYVEPQNLYYNFKPLAGFVNTVPLKRDQYTMANATASSSGGEAIITPGRGSFDKAPEAIFTIDAAGGITPSAASLSVYVYGADYNKANRNPPSFQVVYPNAGKFKVVTGSVSPYAPNITIRLDGNVKLNTSAQANTTYSIDVTAGSHVIQVDNQGTDWINVSSFVFTGVGSSLSTYVLSSADRLKTAGYVLNKQYNWQYVKANGAPAPVNDGSLSIPNLQNGSYHISFYSTATGNLLSKLDVPVTDGTLTFALPSVSWDVVFTAAEAKTLPLHAILLSGRNRQNTNYLQLSVTATDNIIAADIERSADTQKFFLLKSLNQNFAGTVNITDEAPLKNTSYYRVKVQYADGSFAYSNTIRLSSINTFAIYPNPAKSNIFLQLNGGAYRYVINSQSGRQVQSGNLQAQAAQTLSINVQKLITGVYFVHVFDKDQNKVGNQKFIKE